MGDELSKRGRPDRSNVSLNEAWERRYWAGIFEVTESELREAILAVGPQVDELRRYFRSPPKLAS